jgi:hypothetical protein
MEMALRDMFCEPTEGASALLKFSRGVGGRFAYRVDGTSIVAECSGAVLLECTVTFSSREIEAQASKECASLAGDQSVSAQVRKQ